ncbi:unnamed protein product [Ectocarpus sp. CCAP 1310/34]|nr:unnamed protein product [Ectocarpus sp. CCAP 1310/34]
MGKKNKGKKKASERNASTKPGPSTPSPRLSADAAEWHPPSFLAKTIENESEEDQQPAEVGELQGESPSAAATAAEGVEQEHCPGSNTPPGDDEGREDGSTPAPLPSSAPAIASDEPTAAVSPPADGSSSVPGDEQEREDGSTPAPLPSTAPAIESDEPTAAVSTPVDGSSSVPGDEQEREDGSTPVPPDSAQGDSTTASDEPTPLEVLTTEDVKSGSVEVVGDDEAQPDGVERDEATPVPALDDAPSAPSTSEDAGPRNVVPDAALVLEDGAGVAPGEVMATAYCTAADPINACCEKAGEPALAGLSETPTAVATADCQGTPTDGRTVEEATAADTDAVNGSKPEVASGATGQHDKVPGGEEGGEGTRGSEQLTDAVSSDSAENSRSDPDLSYGGGKGNALGGKFLLGDEGGYKGGLLDDPRWRWGSVVAVAAVVLLIGLRRR